MPRRTRAQKEMRRMSLHEYHAAFGGMNASFNSESDFYSELAERRRNEMLEVARRKGERLQKPEHFQDLHVNVSTISGKCHHIAMQSATWDDFQKAVKDSFGIGPVCQRFIVGVEELCQSTWSIIATASEVLLLSRTPAQAEWLDWLDDWYYHDDEEYIFAFANAPDEIREDFDVATRFAARFGLELIPSLLRDDRTFLLRLLRAPERTWRRRPLEHLPEQFCSDREIMLLAVQQSSVLASRLHELTSKDIMRDREVIVAACKSLRHSAWGWKCMGFFHTMLEANQYDKDLVFLALNTASKKEDVECIFQRLPPNLQCRGKIMWATLKTGIDTDGKLSRLGAFLKKHFSDSIIYNVLQATPIEWIPSVLSILPEGFKFDIQFATWLWRSKTFNCCQNFKPCVYCHPQCRHSTRSIVANLWEASNLDRHEKMLASVDQIGSLMRGTYHYHQTCRMRGLSNCSSQKGAQPSVFAAPANVECSDIMPVLKREKRRSKLTLHRAARGRQEEFRKPTLSSTKRHNQRRSKFASSTAEVDRWLWGEYGHDAEYEEYIDQCLEAA